MKLITRFLLFISIFIGISYSTPSFCEKTSTEITTTKALPDAPIFINIPDTTTQPQLNNMTKQLKSVNTSLQSMKKSEDRNSFLKLLGKVQDISSNADDIIQMLQPRLTGYDQALKLLESTDSGDTSKDQQTVSTNNDFNQYHASLLKNRKDLKTKIQQATIIQLEAKSQIALIKQLLTNIQQIELVTHLPSPLSAEFWRQVGLYHSSDQQRLSRIYMDFFDLFTTTWDQGTMSRFKMFGGIFGALLIIFFVRPFVEKGITKVVEKLVPPTRLRRSLMTLFAAILSSITAGVSAAVIFGSLGYSNAANHQAYDFSEHIINQLFFCGFVLGLYRGFLAVKNPQWRLLPIRDKDAQAINILPYLYALMIFILGVVKYINTASGVSVIGQQFCNGFFTIITCILFLTIPVKLREIGTEQLTTSTTNNGPKLGVFFIGLALPLFCILYIITTLIGYIQLGFSMCVWLNWVILVFSTLSLLRILLIDITNLVLDPDRWIGKKIKLLGVKAQSMEQLATIINGLITVSTILLILASLISPGNFDVSLFVKHLLNVLQSQKIGGLTFSFSSILQAFIIFIVSTYCIRMVRNWLNQKLFPKTNLDHGTRNSIDTIFNYCCWSLVVVIILSTLGITTQNLAWIVSALSVGIGFGLQAIVQNFVSGLILLAERPVRIGDSVTIGGVKGTVMSIKVRATEIQLSDFSRLIVPNSQLITSSVQNSTRSKHFGLLTLKLPVISVQQLEASKVLIMNILKEHEEIVDDPSPKVWVDNITETALIVSITCYTLPSSSTDSVKSDILSLYLASITKLASNNYVVEEKKNDGPTENSEENKDEPIKA